MSQQDSGTPDAPRPSPRDPDQGTDPGRSRPYESLYRDPDGAVPDSHRTTARHYEPSLSPPDDQPPGDVYHWLYRPEPEPEPVSAVTPGPSSAVESDSDGPPTEATSPPDPDDTAVAAASQDVEPRVAPEESAPPDAGQRSREGEPADSARRVWPVILLALLLVGAGVAIALTVGRDDSTERGSDPLAVQPAGPRSDPPDSSNPSETAAPSPSSASSAPATPPGSEPYAGGVLPVAASRVVADCQAPPSTDGQGQAVRYDARQLIDGDASTAWRCEGDGDGRAVVFSFPAGSRIAELGLINGYTKTDPKTRVDRYGEYRRILAVKWTFANGSTFTQGLTDDERSPQKLRIPVQTADQVRLTIVKASQPGGKAKSRDAVLISEATFAAPNS
ncbi:MAG: hypothetical protein ABWY56_10670 [Propionibacteriaceae bacterium]